MRSTPDYLIRAGLDLTPLQAAVKRRNKVCSLPDSSIQKICLKRLIALTQGKNSIKFNWVNQLKKLFHHLDSKLRFDSTDIIPDIEKLITLLFIICSHTTVTQPYGKLFRSILICIMPKGVCTS